MPGFDLSTRPTFPLPHEEFRRRRLRMVWRSGVTWLPLPVGAGAWSLLGVAPWLAGLLALATAAGVAWHWRRSGKALDAKVLRRMIEDSNTAQDDRLRERVRTLRPHRNGAFAMTLLHVIELKQQIEGKIHAGDTLPPQAESVENLVDTLAFEIADQLDELAQYSQRSGQGEEHYRAFTAASKVIGDEIRHAIETLQSTLNQLDMVIDPASSVSLDSPSTLRDLSTSLQEEIELARNIQKRLQADGIHDDGPTEWEEGSVTD